MDKTGCRKTGAMNVFRKLPAAKNDGRKSPAKNFVAKCCTSTNDFTQKKDFEEHLYNKHYMIEPFHCEACDYSTGEEGSLTDHQKELNHRSASKKLHCQECNKPHQTKQLLWTHVDLKHGEQDYTCNKAACNFKTSLVVRMNWHQETVHKESGALCFGAGCTERFWYRGAMMGHIFKEHDSVTMREAKWQCEEVYIRTGLLGYCEDLERLRHQGKLSKLQRVEDRSDRRQDSRDLEYNDRSEKNCLKKKSSIKRKDFKSASFWKKNEA